MADIEHEPVALITANAAKVKRLQAGAKWRYRGHPYRTTEIVSLAGTPPRWQVRGEPEQA